MGKILVGVTGGISAYKAVNVVRLLQKSGHEVRVIMTPNAAKFITPLTFEAITGQKVVSDEFSHHAHPIAHIESAKWADIFLIAPATANTVAKLAYGIADNLLTSTALAFTSTLIIAPAMNNNMYAHVATQTNLSLLKQRGAIIIDPCEGELACGDNAKGRLAEPEQIAAVVNKSFSKSNGIYKGLKIVVTAGPTAEPIDPVRYICNRSSGKMGVAIAKYAKSMGATVTTIIGAIPKPDNMDCVSATSAKDMLDKVLQHLPDADILIMAAAVADYAVENVSPQKIKKDGDTITLNLVKNPDILKNVAKKRENRQIIVGFAAESENLKNNALKKLNEKNLDLIAANDISRNDIGFNADNNEITLFFKDGSTIQSGKDSKDKIAKLVVDNAVTLFKNRNS